MQILNSKNLLQVTQNYFDSIGLGSEASSILKGYNFESAIMIQLPPSCIVSENRGSTTSSNESHIAITGKRRFAFFSEETINATTASSADKKQNILVSMANIMNLSDSSKTSFDNLELKETHTLTKISYRKSTNTRQVQISKIKQDGNEFIMLRKCLNADDLLIFLKLNGKDKFFVIGLPHTFFEAQYEKNNDLLKNLDSPGYITITSALNDIANSVNVTDRINNAEDLSDAIYQQMVDNINDDDIEVDNGIYKAEKFTGNTCGKTSKSNRPPINPKLGKKAIKSNGYKCIFSSKSSLHETFIKPKGKPYMEVHHLIPISKQSNFTNKLDTKANLVPVCPLCHRKIHHGRKSEVYEMLEKLYNDRKDILLKSGISVTLDELKSFYR